MSWVKDRNGKGNVLQKEWCIKRVFIELSDVPTGDINSSHLVQITLGRLLCSCFIMIAHHFYQNFLIYHIFSHLFSCFTRIVECSPPVTGANKTREKYLARDQYILAALGMLPLPGNRVQLRVGALFVILLSL